jgi:hypothetical protein
MKNILLALSLIVVATVWNGCASAGKHPPEMAPQFVWFDDTTPRSVSCPGVQVGRTTDDRMKVIAHLCNREYHRIEVQANCVFMDAQGFTVDETPFQTLIIDENATQDVAFEAFKTNAVRYLVRVRKAR